MFIVQRSRPPRPRLNPLPRGSPLFITYKSFLRLQTMSDFHTPLAVRCPWVVLRSVPIQTGDSLSGDDDDDDDDDDDENA